VRGEPDDDPEHPAGRIRNTKKLLMSAALIMSFYLITTSFVTVVLIPAKQFAAGGSANGRALAYLAHEHLGSAFGTVYDLSTIVILAFAGASALAGLLNVSPRYLPRYGMAPEWGRAIRPLVLIYTAVACAITVIYQRQHGRTGRRLRYRRPCNHDVCRLRRDALCPLERQLPEGDPCLRSGHPHLPLHLGGEHTRAARRHQDRLLLHRFHNRRVASFPSAALARAQAGAHRDRREGQEVHSRGQQGDEIHIIAHRCRFADDPEEYARKLEDQREYNRIPKDVPVLFLEIEVEDPSEFEEEVLEVRGVSVGDHKVLRGERTVVPNAIAAFLLYLRDETGKTPNCYLGWTEGNPFAYVIRYILFGEGDTAPVTHEVLREAEPNLERRPIIHVGGQ
jgi:hypothetical protein